MVSLAAHLVRRCATGNHASNVRLSQHQPLAAAASAAWYWHISDNELANSVITPHNLFYKSKVMTLKGKPCAPPFSTGIRGKCTPKASEADGDATRQGEILWENARHFAWGEGFEKVVLGTCIQPEDLAEVETNARLQGSSLKTNHRTEVNVKVVGQFEEFHEMVVQVKERSE